jgi:GTP-binding protein
MNVAGVSCVAGLAGESGVMKFIDEATIEVTAGNGGDGCSSFRREKYVPMGGPDGGDGGHGGSVIFRTKEGITTLMDVRYRRHFKAGRGGHGKGKQMTGRSGEDKVVFVPVGSVVFDAGTGEFLADLDRSDQDWVAAAGGRGGKGNMRYVSSTNQAPRKFTKGTMGEKKKLRLELKLLADVGLVGLPNAGKSTLISAVSNARPKVADYPFTTKVPSLGLVRLGDGASFVIADIPGLIEGASEGAGMGIKFLKHIDRTKLILHLIDISDPSHTDPVESYRGIRSELQAFNPEILDRPEIVVLTKTDLPEVRDLVDDTKRVLVDAGAEEIFAVSAPTQDGTNDLMKKVEETLARSGS